MKAFSYRLEVLLTIRKSKTAKCLEEYGRVVKRRQEVEQAYENCLRKRENISESLSQLRGESFSVSAQEVYMVGLEENEGRIVEVKRMMDVAKEEERVALAGLVEAKKAEGILEKLKDRKWVRYVKERLKEEDRILEEFARAKVNRM